MRRIIFSVLVLSILFLAYIASSVFAQPAINLPNQSTNNLPFKDTAEIIFGTGGEGGTPGPRPDGFTYYCQYAKVDADFNAIVDNFWDYTYSRGRCDIYGSGCGPTSIAMAMSSQGFDIKPDDASRQNNSYRETKNIGCDKSGTGTTDFDYVVKPWAENKGFKMTYNLARNTCASCWGNINLQEIKNYINNGNYVIGMAGVKVDQKSGLTSDYIGHIFVITDVDVANHSVTAYDPTFCRNYKGVRTLRDVNSQNVSVGCYEYTDSGGNKQRRCGWRGAWAIRKL